MSSSNNALQDAASVDEFLNAAATETLPLFEHLEFEFLLEYDVSDSDGIAFLEAVRATHPDLPFVIFTEHGSEEIASEAISASVSGYLQRESGSEQYRTLAQRVRNAVTRTRARSRTEGAHQRARTILEAAPDAIVVLVDGAFVYSNPAAIELFGADGEGAMTGLSVEDVVCADDVEHVRDDLEAIESGDVAHEPRRWTLQPPTGDVVPVDVTAYNVAWDGRNGVVAIMRALPARRDHDHEYRETIRQLRGVLDTVEAAIAMKDTEGRYLLLNRTHRESLDADDGTEVVGKTDYDFLPEAVADRCRADDERAFETERTIRSEQSIPAPDGTHTRLTLKSPMYDESGELYAVCAVSTDVTEQRERERRQRKIIDRMTDAIIEVDRNWRFTTVDEEAERIYGMDAEELLGRNVWDVFPDAVNTKFYETYHRVMETREPDSLEDYYEGMDTWFQVRVYPSDDGGLSIYFQDVTESKERERVFREMYEVMADTGRSFTDQVDVLLELGCDTLGVAYGTLSRIEGDNYIFEAVHALEDTIQDGDVVPLSATNCERVASTEQTLVLDNIERDAPDLTAKAGYKEWRIACYLGAPVFVDGDVYGTLCFYDDRPRANTFAEWEITLVDLMGQWVSYELARERNSERLQRQNERLKRQNERLEEFASIVSHDLRNPLNVAEGRVELARKEYDSRHLDDASRAHDRMRTLIEDILTLAQVGEDAVEIEDVDLADAIDSCWTTVDTADATVRVDSDAVVRADRSSLYQLFENLIRNAVEHAGTDVTITVADLDGGFSVEDDGPGIPGADREQVFEAGYSTSDAGMGIGLRIVEQVAAAHDWNVEITDAATGGTRFEFTGVDAR